MTEHKSERLQLLEQIEKLEKETQLSLAVADPKKYRQNLKKINKLQAQLRKLCSW